MGERSVGFKKVCDFMLNFLKKGINTQGFGCDVLGGGVWLITTDVSDGLIRQPLARHSSAFAFQGFCRFGGRMPPVV